MVRDTRGWRPKANKGLLSLLLVALLAAGASPHATAVASAPAADFAIPDGRFFTQSSGGDPAAGFAVTDDEGVPFWSAFKMLGGVEAVGYPVSQRFVWDGFVTQAMQKAVFQWRPEAPGQIGARRGQVYFVNIFDDLHRANRDDWLRTARATPPPLASDFDAGLGWSAAVAKRVALLDDRPAMKRRYLSVANPIDRFGLPTSAIVDMGNHFAVRLQRATIQEWKVDVPWARAGQTTVANGGDIAKEAGLFPADALRPTTVGGASPTGAMTLRVTERMAIIRVEASPDSRVLARLFRNSQLDATGGAIGTDGRPWHRVRVWNALDGWVSGETVRSSPLPKPSVARPVQLRPDTPMTPPAPPARSGLAGGPWPLDDAATLAEPTDLRNRPGGASLTRLPRGQAVRIDSWAADDAGIVWYRVSAGEPAGWLEGATVHLASSERGDRPLAATFAGKGSWFTYDHFDRAPIDSIIATARANGFTHLYVQVARSPQGFIGRPGLDALLPAAHAAGIRVVGWVVPYLHDVAADVDLTLQVARYETPTGHRLDGVTADVERNLAYADVLAYSQLVRAGVGPSFPLLATTYTPDSAWGRRHPWTAMTRAWDAIAPMDYWHRAGEQHSYQTAYDYVERSVRLIRERTGDATMPIHVIGQSYDMASPGETGHYNPSADETRGALQAARDSGAIGVSFYQWPHTTPAQWRVIGPFDWR